MKIKKHLQEFQKFLKKIIKEKTTWKEGNKKWADKFGTLCPEFKITEWEDKKELETRMTTAKKLMNEIGRKVGKKRGKYLQKEYTKAAKNLDREG